MDTIGSPLLWLVFGGVVVAALLVDLVLMRHGGPHKVTFKEAAWWSLGWIALAMAFNAWLWRHGVQQCGVEAGNRIGMEFLTGYLVEKALAVDNIFVFLMIFGYFAVPEMQRQRALVIGIVGAIVLRAILIFDTWNPHLSEAERHLLTAFFDSSDASGFALEASALGD